MAGFNELQVGRFNRLVQKLLSMKGRAALNTLSPELSAHLPLFHGAENRYLEAWDRFGVGLLAAPIAAVNGGAQLRNPTGSNVIAVVEKVGVAESLADTGLFLSIGALTADLTTQIVQPFDSRGRTAATCIASSGTNIANLGAGTGIVQTKTVAGTPIDLIVTDIQEIPLLPGQGLRVASTVQNVNINVSFWWRERFLEDSERA